MTLSQALGASFELSIDWSMTDAARVSIGSPAVSAEDVAALVPELLAAARYLTRNEDDARDVVQSTVELGLRHMRDLRERERLRAWLFAIEAREASRWRRRFRDAIALGSSDVVARPSADMDSQSIVLRLAIEGLPRQQRLAVVLHHLVGLSTDETAHAMGLTSNTIKTHLRLGLQALREALHD